MPTPPLKPPPPTPPTPLLLRPGESHRHFAGLARFAAFAGLRGGVALVPGIDGAAQCATDGCAVSAQTLVAADAYSAHCAALFTRVYRVKPTVKQAARAAFLTMLLWPALIAWRRYFQGQLIRAGRGHVLGWASLARLVAFALVLGMGFLLSLPGAWLGALALMLGIALEASVVTGARGAPRPDEPEPKLPATLPEVTRFYLPLAGTMVAMWGDGSCWWR